MNLKTHEEIHEKLTSAEGVKLLKGLISREEANRRKRATQLARLNVFLVEAAAGREALRGNVGRAVEAVAEMRRKPEGIKDLQPAGEVIKNIGTHLHFAVLSLDLERLDGFNPEEKERLSHALRNIAGYLQQRGNFLARYNKWHAKG